MQYASSAAKTMSLWDSVRDSLQKTAEKAGSVAMIAGQKTKLNAETLLVDRDITLRKQLFGVQLYEYVAPLSSTPEFYASDDRQTDTLRPPLLMAQREIAALEIRRKNIKEQQAQAEVTRRAAFPTPAQSIGGKVLNAGKSATLAANEAKLMTDMASIVRLIQAQKEEFGEKLYETLVELEDKDGWLPTDREIRSIYDQTRRDVEKLVAKRASKIQELAQLDDPNAAVSATTNGGQSAQYATPTVPASTTNTAPTQNVSTYGATAPAGNAPVAASYGSTQPYAPQQSATGHFASTTPTSTTSTVPSYGAPQQTKTVDPFATSRAPVSSNSFPNTTSYAPPAPAPSADLFAGMGSAFPPAPAPAADPFANAAGYSAPAPANYDPFAGMTLTSGPAPVDPFAPQATSNTTAASNNTDPFAGLSTSGSAPTDPFAGTIFAGTSQGSTKKNTSQFNGMR